MVDADPEAQLADALSALDSLTDWDGVLLDEHSHPTIQVKAPLRVEHIEQAFAALGGSAHAVLLNAREYADLRRYSRERLELENWLALLRRGLMAWLGRTLVVTSRGVHPGVVIVVGRFGEGWTHQAIGVDRS